MGNCFSNETGPIATSSTPAATKSAEAATAVPKPAVVSSGPPPAPGGKPKKVSNGILEFATDELPDKYDLGKVLGRGQFGVIRLATDRSTGNLYACKSISKRKLTCQDDIDDVVREIQIMKHLAGHPNITKIKDVFEDKSYAHFIMDLCQGGELFDRIVAKGHYSEKDAAALCRSIVSVVAHCHSMGVIHRDLKPENFLMATTVTDSEIKATDFGLSVFFKPSEHFQDIVGSAYYVAPEVLKRKYTKECDIWSCGVILYILLSGVPPFWGDSESQIFQSILKGKLDLDSDPWPKISREAKDCVKRMLVMDPAKRATADEVLQHAWMRENGVASDRPLDNAVVAKLRGFAAMNRLKREALKLIAQAMPAEELEGLRNLFKALDADGSGTITVAELREGVKANGALNMNEEDLAQLIDRADADHDGQLDYNEFLAATINLTNLENEENLRKAFQYFDMDGSGTIDLHELQEALHTGGALTAEIEQILKEVDTDGDGAIDYKEFCAMMTRGNEVFARSAQPATTRTAQR